MDLETLYLAARQASLPAVPKFAELRHQSRDTLFHELGYTFWNRELLDALAVRMQSDCWLELAAGTGRLTAELVRRGVRIAATDDYSQAPEAVRASQRSISYGAWVGKLSAREAVVASSPAAVICAWPPLGSCLVPDLLTGSLPGCHELRLLVCIGDPTGATEAPTYPHELPAGWALERWPECERWLRGFNDPAEASHSYSRLLVYRHIT